MRRLRSILNSEKIRVHAAVALGAWLLLFVAWTALRQRLPSPEIASPWFYGAAFLLIANAVSRMQDQAMRRRYWILPALTLIAFLDEIAWGTEWGLPRIYLEDLDAYIYDLHNLFTLVVELIQKWLRLADWHPEMLNAFLRHDLNLLILGALFILALRLRQQKENVARDGFWLMAILMLANGALAVAALARLPADPKNVWLLGLSLTRWLMIVGLAALSLLPLWLAWWRPKRISAGLQALRPRIKRWQWLAGLLLLAGLLFQLWAPFGVRPGLNALLLRFGPLIGWGMGALLLSWLMLESMKGSLSRPLREYAEIKRDFFRRHPALIYIGAMLALLLISQINDKGFTHFTYFIDFPEIGIPNWDMWIEEIMEVAGAVEMMLAAVVLRLREV